MEDCIGTHGLDEMSRRNRRVLGARGALLVTTEQTERCPAIRVSAKSTVGAGDSLLGGIVFLASTAAYASEMPSSSASRRERQRCCEATRSCADVRMSNDSTNCVEGLHDGSVREKQFPCWINAHSENH